MKGQVNPENDAANPSVLKLSFWESRGEKEGEREGNQNSSSLLTLDRMGVLYHVSSLPLSTLFSSLVFGATYPREEFSPSIIPSGLE